MAAVIQQLNLCHPKATWLRSEEICNNAEKKRDITKEGKNELTITLNYKTVDLHLKLQN